MSVTRDRPVLGTSANVSSWPAAAQNDVRSNVGKWEKTGLVVLTLSFVGHDPELTFWTESLYPLRGNPGSKLFKADRNLANNRFCGAQCLVAGEP
jgi:hypothetical protein